MLDLSHVFANFPMLDTERCILRALTPDDAADLLPVWSDPRVIRYVGRPPISTLEESARRVRMLSFNFDVQSGISWAVVPRAHGRAIGTFVFWHLNEENYRAEIGYEIAHEWWGQGLMTEVVRAGLDFGFTTMGLNSVEAETDPENAGSRRLLEKLGFVREGYFREYYYRSAEARFTDKSVYSLLKSAWMSRDA